MKAIVNVIMTVMATIELIDRPAAESSQVVSSFDHHQLSTILTISTQCAYWYTPIPTAITLTCSLNISRESVTLTTLIGGQ